MVNDTKLANDHCSPENFKHWQKLVTANDSPSPGGETSEVIRQHVFKNYSQSLL